MAAKDDLAKALENLASIVAVAPVSITGMSVKTEVNAPVTGNVTSLKVSAMGGAGSGSTTGLSVTVNYNGAQGTEREKLSAEIMDAAKAVREDQAPQSWINGLINRVRAIGSEAIKAALTAVITAYAVYYGGPPTS